MFKHLIQENSQKIIPEERSTGMFSIDSLLYCSCQPATNGCYSTMLIKNIILLLILLIFLTNFHSHVKKNSCIYSAGMLGCSSPAFFCMCENQFPLNFLSPIPFRILFPEATTTLFNVIDSALFRGLSSENHTRKYAFTCFYMFVVLQ